MPLFVGASPVVMMLLRDGARKLAKMRKAARGLASVCAMVLIPSCAGPSSTSASRTLLPHAGSTKVTDRPAPADLGMDSNCKAPAALATALDSYDASKLPVVTRVVFMLREHYVESQSMRWNRALFGALQTLSRSDPEISVEGENDSLPASFTLATSGHTCRVAVLGVSQPWQARAELQKVMKFLQAGLSPLPSKAAARRMVNLEIAAANGILASVDPTSFLIDTASPIALFAEPPRREPSPDLPQSVLGGAHKIGYVRLNRLSDQAQVGITEAVQRFVAAGVLGIVLDLRGNTGGLFDQAIKVVDAFAKHGVIASIVAKTKPQVIEAHDDGSEPMVPLIVLIDQRTAAGGAIVGGALRDLNGAILLGAKTNANRSIQMLFDIPSPFVPADGDGPKLLLRLTTARWVLGRGFAIESNGVRPDVEMDPDLLASEGDNRSVRTVPAVAAAFEALVATAKADRATTLASLRAAVATTKAKNTPGFNI